MITPAEIRAKAARAYLPFLRAWLRGEPFTPLDIPVGALPNDVRTLRQALAALLEGAKEQRGHGYSVQSQTRQTRAYGQQSLPERIHVGSAADLLWLIGKTDEFAAFVEDVALIRAAFPELGVWLETYPQQVIDQHGAWPHLLLVCAYMRSNPRPSMYIRELPVAVHTKFIEQHLPVLNRLLDALLPAEAIDQHEKLFERRYGLRYDTPLVRIRLLDAALKARLELPLSDLAAPTAQLARLPCEGQSCLVVENKMVFLTLPALANGIAIFGSGFQVELLGEVPWLHACRIWYWGDLDAQGFQILARLRSLFPQVVSLMMDATTFETFREFALPGTPCSASSLPHLTADEQALHAWLARTNMRLEQERISPAFAQRQIEQATSAFQF